VGQVNTFGVRCPSCNAPMRVDMAYDPPVCKCPECKTEIEWEGDDERISEYQARDGKCRFRRAIEL